MSLFKKKFIDPLVSVISGKVEAALKTENIADRTENLLAAKDESKFSFRDLVGYQTIKSIAGLALGMAGVMMLASTGPIPLLVGGGFLLAGVAMVGTSMHHNIEIQSAYGALQQQIGGEVTKLSVEHPQETMKSLRFRMALEDKFNSAVLPFKVAIAPAPAISAPVQKLG